ncbi:hypothetical protein K458DRAFT_118182 [Lentithecium fluviatile CBS 122367]|uniref:Uncharacterized protein n=1 Tax=Lentithecium fluviatile CBS 122367 TaxID=1168545 RepID=A0A6G1IM57_9PLEO|nr:hypothetical protein K458DRAFT_118182 [Lentithecium fluviatile CBS 122367]
MVIPIQFHHTVPFYSSLPAQDPPKTPQAPPSVSYPSLLPLPAIPPFPFIPLEPINHQFAHAVPRSKSRVDRNGKEQGFPALGRLGAVTELSRNGCT